MTNGLHLHGQAKKYLTTMCVDITERCVGSDGNRQATNFFNEILKSYHWKTEMPEFDAMDWIDGGAMLKSGDNDFSVHCSPYSLGGDFSALLIGAANIAELESIDCTGKILFLHGEIAKEQLMPKNFVFYNPEEHQRIISLLEKKQPLALVCATLRNAELAGGVYPFPLIEDGDFDIPSVFMTAEEGEKLRPYVGKTVHLQAIAKRVFGKGYNVIGKKGTGKSGRIVVTAHIDAKKGTPGAIDNATGVTILLLLSELLKDYSGNVGIDLVAFNGEDYFSVPGQMNYIASQQDQFEEVILNINIDGAGYVQGPSSIAIFDAPENITRKALDTAKKFGIVEGPQWPQGDHSIFLQFGRPALAFSSHWFIEHIADQDITHTPKDKFDIVDIERVVELSKAIQELIGIICQRQE